MPVVASAYASARVFIWANIIPREALSFNLFILTVFGIGIECMKTSAIGIHKYGKWNQTQLQREKM